MNRHPRSPASSCFFAASRALQVQQERPKGKCDCQSANSERRKRPGGRFRSVF